MAAPPRPDGDLRLPHVRRITRSAEIRALFSRGKRSRTASLDVFDSASPAAHPRVGLVVPKHRHRIVDRNLLKRRIREVLRTEVLPRLSAGGCALDVLVRARREAYDTSWEALRNELIGWTERRCSRGSSS